MKIVQGWIDTAVEIDYGNKSMDRNGWKPRIIVLHGTAGGSSAQDIATYFRDSPVDASAHIVIGQDGTVVQGISCDVAAWANGPTTAGHAAFLPEGTQVNGNWYTISIEHVKPSTDNSDQLTEAQKNASFEVIKTICAAYGIPGKMATSVNEGGLLPHSAFDPINRARCPGPYPWNELWAYLKAQPQQEDTMFSNIQLSDVKGYFTDAGNDAWHCTPKNVKIGGAIRKYYVTHFGPAIHGLPNFNEVKLYPNDKDPKKAVIAIQFCEHTIIVFDPYNVLDRPWKLTNDPEPRCYTARIDSGFGQQLVAQSLLAPLQEQVKQLQQQLASAQNDKAQVAQLQQQITQKEAQIAQLQTELAAASGDKYLNALRQIGTLVVDTVGGTN